MPGSGSRLIVFFIACAVFALPFVAAALVDINTADEAALETLSGIGPSKAIAIIEYRTAYGPFISISDIQNVSGIGPTTYAGIKDFITVSGDDTDTSTDDTDSDMGTSTDTDVNATTTEKKPVVVDSYVPPPAPAIFADAGDDRTVIVGADVAFTGRAYDRSSAYLDPAAERVRFSWNFGDGSTAEGASVLHHFSYPGRYSVVLSIAHELSAASDRIIVTAEPAQLGFTVNHDGSVSIANESGRDLDLSRWIVRSFGHDFFVPEGTVILAGSTVRIPQSILGFAGTSAASELLYPNGTLAVRAGEEPASTSTPAVAIPTAAPIVHAAVRAVLPVTARPGLAAESEASSPDASSTAVAATAAAAASRGGRASYWWIGAILFALVAGIGAAAAKRTSRSEWNIIESP